MNSVTTALNRRGKVCPLNKPPSSERILQAFNTWSFKREQPSDPALMAGFTAAAIEAGRPMEFVLYWGKGPRDGLAQPDLECLDYLASLGQRIKASYDKGAKFTLIFTDTHAQLNGHSQFRMDSYFGDVGRAAAQRNFEVCKLGALIDASDVPELVTDAIPADTIERLSRAAERWFRGEGSPHDGAIRYYKMNMIEKRAVERQFPHAVFVTFNGSEFRDLFPDKLPIFYMYSLRRGMGVKPWFMADDATCIEAADRRIEAQVA